MQPWLWLQMGSALKALPNLLTRCVLPLAPCAAMPQPETEGNPGLMQGAAAVSFFAARGSDQDRIDCLPNDAVVRGGLG